MLSQRHRSRRVRDRWLPAGRGLGWTGELGQQDGRSWRKRSEWQGGSVAGVCQGAKSAAGTAPRAPQPLAGSPDRPPGATGTGPGPRGNACNVQACRRRPARPSRPARLRPRRHPPPQPLQRQAGALRRRPRPARALHVGPGGLGGRAGGPRGHMPAVNRERRMIASGWRHGTACLPQRPHLRLQRRRPRCGRLGGTAATSESAGRDASAHCCRCFKQAT